MIKKITGKFQTAAKLTDSWNEPSLVAESPEKAITMLSVPSYCYVRAAPTASAYPPPTIPFVP